MASGPFAPRHGRRVGLSITDRALHAVELSDGGPRVLRRATQLLPTGIVVDGSVREREPFVQACTALWGEGRFGTRSVVASLGSQDAVVRTAELPPLARRDVRGALRFELADLLPFPVDESTIDATEIGRHTDDKGEETVRHLVVAARAASVEALAGALGAAGLRPRAFDVAAFSAVRLDLLGIATAASGKDSSKSRPAVPTAVVLDGEGVLSIAVHVGGRVRFARTLYLDQSFDHELSAVLEAELSAIDVHRSGGQVETPDARTDPVSEAVTATLDHIRMTDADAAARVVHVLGAHDASEALARAIDRRTGLPTHVRTVELHSPEPLLGVDLLAAGHALRVQSPQQGPHWPKLGQHGQMQSARGLRRQVVGLTAATAMVAVAGLILVGPDPASAHGEAESLQGDVDTMTAQLAALEEQDRQATELVQLQNLTEEIETAAVDWAGMLAAIEAGRPEGSNLLSVEAIAADPEAEEEGVLRLTVEASDTSAVEPWLELLDGVDGLSDPWLEVASATDTGQTGAPSTFTIRASVTSAGTEAAETGAGG
jgi:type IV pilus assembly protein PilM